MRRLTLPFLLLLALSAIGCPKKKTDAPTDQPASAPADPDSADSQPSSSPAAPAAPAR